jgi:hypothetical protein
VFRGGAPRSFVPVFRLNQRDACCSFGTVRPGLACNRTDPDERRVRLTEHAWHHAEPETCANGLEECVGVVGACHRGGATHGMVEPVEGGDVAHAVVVPDERMALE